MYRCLREGHCIYNFKHADLKVGFEETSYSVAEPGGVLEIPVRIFDDDDGTSPDIGLPLGVRVTSRDGSAVGNSYHFALCYSIS